MWLTYQFHFQSIGSVLGILCIPTENEINCVLHWNINDYMSNIFTLLFPRYRQKTLSNVILADVFHNCIEQYGTNSINIIEECLRENNIEIGHYNGILYLGLRDKDGTFVASHNGIPMRQLELNSSGALSETTIIKNEEVKYDLPTSSFPDKRAAADIPVYPVILSTASPITLTTDSSTTTSNTNLTMNLITDTTGIPTTTTTTTTDNSLIIIPKGLETRLYKTWVSRLLRQASRDLKGVLFHKMDRVVTRSLFSREYFNARLSKINYSQEMINYLVGIRQLLEGIRKSPHTCRIYLWYNFLLYKKLIETMSVPEARGLMLELGADRDSFARDVGRGQRLDSIFQLFGMSGILCVELFPLLVFSYTASDFKRYLKFLEQSRIFPSLDIQSDMLNYLSLEVPARISLLR
ncbi:hypothetical protein BD770DRAFT_413825 [Pilaira anomala]|nr:hypothetical protein BD770DRAFT_413825 [Pilaira anomala]